MGYRVLYLTIISAKDLKDVNLFSKMDVYATVALSYSLSKERTSVAKKGGKNPTWNSPMKFIIHPCFNPNDLFLHIKLKCKRTLGPNRDIGELDIPVKELLNHTSTSFKSVSYQLRKPSGKHQGVLNLSYRYGKTVSEYPTNSPAHVSTNPRPHVPGYGYGYGYGYGPARFAPGYPSIGGTPLYYYSLVV